MGAVQRRVPQAAVAEPVSVASAVKAEDPAAESEPESATPLQVSGVSGAADLSQAEREGRLLEDAVIRAAESGQRVQVPELATDQVWALPSGSFEREMYPSPVRVQRDGRWVPVNLALASAGAGWWAPKVAVVEVTRTTLRMLELTVRSTQSRFFIRVGAGFWGIVAISLLAAAALVHRKLRNRA